MKGKSKDQLAANIEHIAQMKQQNQTLQEDLQQDGKNNDFEKMNTLQEECAQYAKKIEVESKKQRDLEQLIQNAEQQLQDHRKKMSNSDGIQLPSLIKKQKTLESQLEQIKLKHNESLAEINQLMEQINTARRERVIYSNVFKKLESDIRAKEEEFKKQLLIRKQIEHELNQCQEQFDKMKEQANQVVESNKQEYTQILKTNRLDDTEEQSPKNQQQQQQQQQQQIKQESKSQQIKESQQPKQQIQMQKDVEDVTNYELMFEKLKKETGLNSIEEIIHTFRTIEDTNNELFKRANILSDQIDSEEKQIEELQKQISQYTKNQQKEDNEFEDEKFKFAQQLERSEKLDKEIQQAENEIKEYERELLEIANKLQIKYDPNSEVTLMQLVEQRAYELVDLCRYYDNHNYTIDSKKNDQESTVSNQDDQTMKDLLDGVENEKEAEKIMSKDDFKKIGSQELQQFQKKIISKKKRE
ncbi:unnamed protein product [Paramecium sonneborni]|uniref:ODAD1 central coiled coil region domain-containing protein n=1 Tax=Paramecium sonneborni TaxID=65129 RepID=A0A8S1KVH5_9CILI|nr:unnamed protein product [Paramecium sonneborni]